MTAEHCRVPRSDFQKNSIWPLVFNNNKNNNTYRTTYMSNNATRNTRVHIAPWLRWWASTQKHCQTHRYNWRGMRWVSGMNAKLKVSFQQGWQAISGCRSRANEAHAGAVRVARNIWRWCTQPGEIAWGVVNNHVRQAEIQVSQKLQLTLTWATNYTKTG